MIVIIMTLFISSRCTDASIELDSIGALLGDGKNISIDSADAIKVRSDKALILSIGCGPIEDRAHEISFDANQLQYLVSKEDDDDDIR